MDYVVYGTGYGATLMLLGYAVRAWGPGWRFREGEEAAYDRREYTSARSSWARFTAGLGAVIATGGAALVLVTFLLMLLDPGNGIGNTVALVVTGLMLVGVAVWAWLYFEKFGTWGVVSLPNALSSYEPMRYDGTRSRSRREDAAGEPAVDEDAFIAEADEDEYEYDDEPEEGDDDEFAARSSKYEMHHPSRSGDQEDERDAGAREGPFVEDDRFEAQYAKYETHPASTESPDEAASDDTDVEEIEEYVETLTPAQVSEDIADLDDDEEEPFENDHVGEAWPRADDAGEHDALENLPEAHDAPDLLPPADEGESQTAGGREAALRRLRERQARQRAERTDDDA